MTKFEKCVDALCRLAVAEDSTAAARAKAEIRNLVNDEAVHDMDVESLIRSVLLELGSPDHLQGHPYVIRAITLVIENPMYINNITAGIYPQLATEFDATPQRVERAIRHLIEVTFERCDLDVIEKYFGNTVSCTRGKATNGEFIARIANVVKMRLKDAA